jgi:hypothetical protein
LSFATSLPLLTNLALLLGLSLFFGLAFEEFQAQQGRTQPGGVQGVTLPTFSAAVFVLNAFQPLSGFSALRGSRCTALNAQSTDQVPF